MENNHAKIPATVRIFTFNSAKVLERCLQSLAQFDDIMIMDANSVDNTLEIARRYGARITKQFDDDIPNHVIHDWPAMVKRATDTARYDWVLYIDSDETASAGLTEEVRQIVTQPIRHYMYEVPNKIIYRGRVIQHAVSYPGYQYRLMNRTSGAYYDGNPHYHLMYDRSKYTPGRTKNPWYVHVDDTDARIKPHFVAIDALRDKDQTIKQFIRWTLWGKPWGIVKILLKTGWLYLRYGFKDTMPPALELARIKYKALLFWYLIKQRLGFDIVVDTKPKFYMPTDQK